MDPSSRWQPRFWSIWFGQALSLVGSALTQFVLLWWITSTTGSANALATAGIAALLPQALLGPIGGVIADRLPRRLIMIVADSITAACMIVLVILFATDSIQLWHVYTLMFIRSSMQAFQSPAASSSTANLVPTDWLPRVAGLNQSLQGIMTIAAAPLGALALAWLPLQGALMIDVVTAVLGITPLLFHAIPQPKETQNKTSSVLTDFKEGVRFVMNDRGLLSLYALLGLVVLTIMPTFTLTPLLVKQHFSGGAGEVALMEGISGVGMILGGLFITAFPPRRPIVTLLVFFAVSCGTVAFTALSSGNALWLAVIWWTVSGISFSIGNAPMMSVLQTVVPNHMQGRTLSLMSTVMGLAGPIGLLIAGPLGEAIGVRGVFIWGGALSALVCALGLLSPALHSLERASLEATKESPAPNSTTSSRTTSSEAGGERATAD
ncbi:MAG: MFS transporter [Pleurocapsa sp. SU_196_0]|nr:MFS transporter [Pleurocapsa sp. SU_196_0]